MVTRRQFSAAIGAAGANALAQTGPSPTRGAWFREARYGMFIHFGIYAVHGRTSWAPFLEKIPPEEYAKYKDEFNPSAFNAREWVKLAKDAGQRYMVITAKHHDGFSLYNTRLSDFSIMKTRFGRDLCAELAEECHKQGIVFSFYFSLLDWHHPAFRKSQMPGSDIPSEFLEFAHGQVRELCTNYGKLGALWFDGNWGHTPEQWKAKELLDMIHQLQPDALVNNRTGLAGDFSTPEMAMGGERKEGVMWENCMTITDNWEWSANDQRFKTAAEVVQLLARTAAGGGNLLLDVGPMPDGRIDPVSTSTLLGAGEWLKRNGESIYGTDRFRSLYYDKTFTTKKGDKVYLHLFDWAPGAGCDLWQLQMKNAKRAYFLEGGKELKLAQSQLFGLRLIAKNAAAKPSPDTVIVFEGVEPARSLFG